MTEWHEASPIACLWKSGSRQELQDFFGLILDKHQTGRLGKKPGQNHFNPSLLLFFPFGLLLGCPLTRNCCGQGKHCRTHGEQREDQRWAVCAELNDFFWAVLPGMIHINPAKSPWTNHWTKEYFRLRGYQWYLLTLPWPRFQFIFTNRPNDSPWHGLVGWQVNEDEPSSVRSWDYWQPKNSHVLVQKLKHPHVSCNLSSAANTGRWWFELQNLSWSELLYHISGDHHTSLFAL